MVSLCASDSTSCKVRSPEENPEYAEDESEAKDGVAYSLERRHGATRWGCPEDTRWCGVPLLVARFLESQGDVVLEVRISGLRKRAVCTLEGALTDMLLHTAVAVLAAGRGEDDVCVASAERPFPESWFPRRLCAELLSGPVPPYALSPPSLLVLPFPLSHPWRPFLHIRITTEYC